MQEALAIFRRVGSRWGEGWTHHLLSESHRHLRRYAEAIEHFQQALTATARSATGRARQLP
ncbi:MAG: tetratricopeptide repeat protein [Pseudonocardiaceae bacterium]